VLFISSVSMRSPGLAPGKKVDAAPAISLLQVPVPLPGIKQAKMCKMI
jgi:hypothetical protein